MCACNKRRSTKYNLHSMLLYIVNFRKPCIEDMRPSANLCSGSSSSDWAYLGSSDKVVVLVQNTHSILDICNLLFFHSTKQSINSSCPLPYMRAAGQSATPNHQGSQMGLQPILARKGGWNFLQPTWLHLGGFRVFFEMKSCKFAKVSVRWRERPWFSFMSGFCMWLWT